jgi:hypothetical protein
MEPRRKEVERGALLELLEPEGVTNAQLLRWVQAGLLPHPRREGLGRGQGGVSYYPAVTVFQAKALAGLLNRQRNLGEAGWRLWMLGYHVTPFARGLLEGELESEEEFHREELARLRAGETSRVARAIQRERSGPAWDRVRAALRLKGLSRVAKMVSEQRLGRLRSDEYSDVDWANYQDLVVALFQSDLADDQLRPTPAELQAGVQTLSNTANLKELRALLGRANDRLLETVRNETQWLTEFFRAPTSREFPIADRDYFLRFLRLRMEPNGPEEIQRLIEALGQKEVPPPPVERRFRLLQSPSAPTG